MKKAVTGTEIAKLAHVSQSTVSRVLSPHCAWRISPEKRKEILSICRRYGYDGAPGRKSRQGCNKTFKVCFVLGQMEMDLLETRFMIRQLCDLLQDVGYALTLIHVDFSSVKHLRNVKRVIDSNIADIFLIGSTLLHGQTPELLRKTSSRVICYYTDLFNEKYLRCHRWISSIRSDYTHAFEQAVETLPREMLSDMIFWGRDNPTTAEKLHFLRQCFRRKQYPLSWIRPVLFASGSASEPIASYRKAVRFIRENTDRLSGRKLYWCCGSGSTAALHDELESLGQINGRDYQIVTFRSKGKPSGQYENADDDFCFLQYDAGRLAHKICELILAMLDDPSPRHETLHAVFQPSRTLAEKLNSRFEN